MQFSEVDIIIPVFNEGCNIGQTLTGIVGRVRVPHHIFIVYDVDDDDTLPPARATADQLGIEVHFLRNKYGRGVLNAIRTGFEDTSSPYVVIVMADLSDALEDIDVMHSTAVENKASVVCGSRHMKGGQQCGGPLFKRMLSRLAGTSLHWLAGVPTHDVTNAFKLFSREVISTIPIDSCGGFELCMELTIKAHLDGYRVVEIPTTWHDRTLGVSKFRIWAWFPHYLRWYLYACSKVMRRYW